MAASSQAPASHKEGECWEGPLCQQQPSAKGCRHPSKPPAASRAPSSLWLGAHPGQGMSPWAPTAPPAQTRSAGGAGVCTQGTDWRCLAPLLPWHPALHPCWVPGPTPAMAPSPASSTPCLPHTKWVPVLEFPC